MRHPLLRSTAVALILGLGCTTIGRATANAADATPNRLVVLSTTDAKGKTDVCGCSIPKGGFARRSSFGDSIRAAYSQVLLVDAGGFFPEPNDTLLKDVANFMMDAMQLLKTDAVGMGETELKFGYPFLKDNIARSGLPLVSSNLMIRATGKPALTPYIIKKVGTTKVGIFSLMSDKMALGPSQDMLQVEEPTAAARRVVAEMRKKGATVTVMLSQMGKVDSEDLVANVPGIDVLIVGHTTSLLMKGRRVKETVVCYGGEQGQYMGRTLLTLDRAGKMTNGECDVYMMGPEVTNDPEVAQLVKDFETGMAEKQKAADKARAAARAASSSGQ
jgi:2',3'-cyclic-nucleotide 2'-phosphodiesterase (5'-nucleotidase family)